jgi:lysophospholipase L1-like esterase
VLLSTSLALLLAEGALRVYHALKDAREIRALPPVPERALVPSADPERLYEWNPGWSRAGFSINSLGLADDETSLEKPAGVFRIAFVGDSITANFQLLPRPEIYANELERLLNADPARGRSFESLNFGVNGYAILQNVQVLRTRVRAFEPDLVVFQLCLNDPHSGATAYGGDAPIGRSRLWNFVFRRLDPVRYWGWFFVDRHYDASGVENVRKGMLAIGEEARRGPPVLAVLFPYLYAPAYERWGYARYHEPYREAAREAGVPLLDLYEAFREAGFVGLRPYPADPIHPDREAHALAARRIAERLDEIGWLPPERSGPLASGRVGSPQPR